MSQKIEQPTPSAWFDLENLSKIYGKHGTGYLGSVNLIPDEESYCAPPVYRQGKVLVRGPDGIVLRDNLCLHRQAPIIEDFLGELRNGHMVCPIHKWTYDRSGDVVGGLKGFCKKLVGKLDDVPVVDVNGYLFSQDGRKDSISALKSFFNSSQKFDAELFSMSRFARDRALVKAEIKETPYSVFLFELNYPDCYHVDRFHPKTFGQVADIDTLEWDFGEGWSMQIVNAVPEISPSAQGLWSELARAVNEKLPDSRKHPFAMWGLVYPGLMLELYYGHFLAVSYLIPKGPYECVNVVEYYMSDEAWLEMENSSLETFVKAYSTSADEDDEICIKMQQGLETLEREGRVLHGPFHDPLEKGMVHYINWLKSRGFVFNKLYKLYDV